MGCIHEAAHGRMLVQGISDQALWGQRQICTRSASVYETSGTRLAPAALLMGCEQSTGVSIIHGAPESRSP